MHLRNSFRVVSFFAILNQSNWGGAIVFVVCVSVSVAGVGVTGWPLASEVAIVLVVCVSVSVAGAGILGWPLASEAAEAKVNGRERHRMIRRRETLSMACCVRLK